MLLKQACKSPHDFAVFFCYFSCPLGDVMSVIDQFNLCLPNPCDNELCKVGIHSLRSLQLTPISLASTTLVDSRTCIFVWLLLAAPEFLLDHKPLSYSLLFMNLCTVYLCCGFCCASACNAQYCYAKPICLSGCRMCPILCVNVERFASLGVYDSEAQFTKDLKIYLQIVSSLS